MVSVIGARRCSMQVRDPSSREHVHDANLVDVNGPIRETVFDPLHRGLIQAHGFVMGYPGIPGRQVQSLLPARKTRYSALGAFGSVGQSAMTASLVMNGGPARRASASFSLSVD